VQAFNLGVQWSFANNWMLDLGYVGSQGRKFPRLFSFNQAPRRPSVESTRQEVWADRSSPASAICRPPDWAAS
jgi:hypothetical protein